MISMSSAHAILSDAKLVQARLEGKVTAEYRGAVAEMFADLVQVTPQWSGNLVSNWFIKIGDGRNPAYREIPAYSTTWAGPGEANKGVQKMGNDPAVTATLVREMPKLDALRWNQKVTFVNRAPYAGDVQAGVGPDGRDIREVNLGPSGEVMMGEYIKLKYGLSGYNIVTRSS